MIYDQNEVSQESLAAELADLESRLEVSTLSDAEYFPQFFQIETIRNCNAKCPFCAVDLWDKSSPRMSDELFEKIAVELGQYKDWVRMVDVQRAGEPLLDKKIAKRVKRLKDLGLRFVTMATNASLLDERRSRELLDAGIDEMMISIDTVDPKRYGEMRVGLKYEEVIRNIEGFFALREKYRPDLKVRARGVSFMEDESSDAAEERERWEAFWGKYRKPQDRIYLKRAHDWGNQKEWEGHSFEKLDVYHPCIVPWSTMHITAMGVVALCPQDFDGRMNLGDINRQSIAEVWKSNEQRRVRELHASGQRNEISYCRGCRLFDPEFSLEKSEQKGRFHVKPNLAEAANS